MAPKTSSLSLVMSTALLLLVATPPAQADLLCEIGCFLRCSSSLDYYAPCVIGCLLTTCYISSPPPPAATNSVYSADPVQPFRPVDPTHDHSIQCGIGCVTMTCLAPKLEGEKTPRPARVCIPKCVRGCDRAYARN